MIKRFPEDVEVDPLVAELRSHGVAIVENFVADEDVDRILEDLAGALGRSRIAGDEFTGRRSKLVHTVVKRSETYRGVLLSDLFQGAVDGVIGDNCDMWRLGASSLMAVFDGGQNQVLHRDEDQYPYVPRGPGQKSYSLSSMLALTDFTLENGATRFIRDSNQWTLDKPLKDEDVEQAVMPKGSVAFWLGATAHGLGVNSTSHPRIGIISICTVGWMRQEENFYGSVPQDMARQYPERLQQMLGWQVHGDLQGFVPGRDPNCQLREWSPS